MTLVHPIARAWISTGGTGARNYDEFADDAEITEIVAANPDSALGVEMPHRAPDSVSKSFAEALPDAVARLERQRAEGRYAPAEEVVVLYRIEEPDRPEEAAYGLFAMVDTDQISTSADEPGKVIRNEDVFIEKVRERVALAEATKHLLSPVLLLQTGVGDELHKALRIAVESAGAPAATDTDHVGRTHAVWPVHAPEPRWPSSPTTAWSATRPLRCRSCSTGSGRPARRWKKAVQASRHPARSSFMDATRRTPSGSRTLTGGPLWTVWTTPGSSGPCSPTHWGSRPATSGSRTSAGTTRPSGWCPKWTPDGPTWPSSSPR
jgi:hypothetical protein